MTGHQERDWQHDTLMRAFRFTLDPTPTQEEQLRRFAGAARWAYNHALALKAEAHQRWRRQIAELVDSGVPEPQARQRVKIAIPNKPAIQLALNQTKGDSRKGIDGVCPWWHEVNTYCFQSAFNDADRAWRNWLESRSGKRAGRAVGYPRFKKRGRSRDSFRIHHDVKRPSIRAATNRRLRVPSLGEIRLHDSARRLARLIDRGDAVVQSVTVSRGGHRWYASVLCKVRQPIPTHPTHRQCAAGTVGLDIGVKTLAALSTGETIANPRHLDQAQRRLRKAAQALSRTDKGSKRREKAAHRLGRVHHEIATIRQAALHQITKRVTTTYATVAIEDLNVAGMTRSARGTIERPGTRVRQKAGLNRAILDVAPAELRRQLTYKTRWYGSRLAICDRWFPSSQTCSTCGWRNPSLTLAERTFRCNTCGLALDRDVNAALNIAAHAAVASDVGETLNARRAVVRPTGLRVGGQAATKREDTASPDAVPPQRRDPLALPPEGPNHADDRAGREGVGPRA